MSICKRTSYLIKKITESARTENPQCHSCDFINNIMTEKWKIVIYCLQQKQTAKETTATTTIATTTATQTTIC